jgi:hypothetical protein
MRRLPAVFLSDVGYIINIYSKGKHCALSAYRSMDVKLHGFCTSKLDRWIEVSGHFHPLVALPLLKNPQVPIG